MITATETATLTATVKREQINAGKKKAHDMEAALSARIRAAARIGLSYVLINPFNMQDFGSTTERRYYLFEILHILNEAGFTTSYSTISETIEVSWS